MVNIRSFLFLTYVCLVGRSSGQTTATVECTSCTSYVLSVGGTNLTVSCPTGTVCATSTSSSTTATSTTPATSTTTTATPTSLCAATNPCDGVVCNRYATFPSSTSCQQYHVCRYRAGLAAYVLTTLTCPGTSNFDQLTLKCTLNTAVSCYNATLVG